MLKTNFDRVNALAMVFSELGIDKIRVFEDIDPQYHAIRYAVNKCGALLLDYVFYINALNAYKLMTRGEVFWQKYAEYVAQHCDMLLDIDHVINLVKEFTYRFNNYAYEFKIRRLQKIEKCVNLRKLMDSKDYLGLAKETARCLGTSYSVKTIVFAVKILYYVHRAQGENTILPFDLPIPVDRRVAGISYTSGMIDLSALNNLDPVEVVMRNAGTIRHLWSVIARTSGIPALHIDSVVWYFGKFLKVQDLNTIYENLDRKLYLYIGKNYLEKLVNELFYRFRFRYRHSNK